MVVVAIIAFIAAAALAFMSTPRARSRDARREEDLKQIQNALSLYISNVGTYPVCATETVVNGTSDCLSAALRAEKTIPVTPTDPKNIIGSCGDANIYIYCYQSLLNGQSFQLRYDLETDAVPNKSPGWQTFTP